MAHGSQHSDLYMLRLLGPVLVAVAPHGRRAPLGLPAEEVVHVLVEHGLRQRAILAAHVVILVRLLCGLRAAQESSGRAGAV